METSYLRRVLRAGSAATFPDDIRHGVSNEPFSFGIQLNQTVQNLFPFSSTLWDGDDGLDDIAEGMISDGSLNATPTVLRSESIAEREQRDEHKDELHRDAPQSTIDAHERNREVASDQDGHIPDRENMGVRDTYGLVVPRADSVMEQAAEASEAEPEADDNKSDLQTGKSDDISASEVVEEYTITVPRTREPGHPNSVAHQTDTEPSSQEPDGSDQAQQLTEQVLKAEVRQYPRDVMGLDKVVELQGNGKSVGFGQKLKEKKQALTGLPSESLEKREFQTSDHSEQKREILEPSDQSEPELQAKEMPTPSYIAGHSGMDESGFTARFTQELAAKTDKDGTQQRVPTERPRDIETAEHKPEERTVRISPDVADGEKMSPSGILARNYKPASPWELKVRFSPERSETQTPGDSRQEPESSGWPQSGKKEISDARKGKERIPPDITATKKDESEDPVRTVQVAQKPTAQQALDATLPIGSLEEGKTHTIEHVIQGRGYSGQSQYGSESVKASETNEKRLNTPSDAEWQGNARENETPAMPAEAPREQVHQKSPSIQPTDGFPRRHGEQTTGDDGHKNDSPQPLGIQPRQTGIIIAERRRPRSASNIAEQEVVDGSESRMRSARIVQRPASQQQLDANLLNRSQGKSEAQVSKLSKDVASIAKRLDEHVNGEKPEPAVQVFLPGRPPSRNLGGWGVLGRSYIR